MPLDTTFAPAQVDFSQLGQLGQDIGNLYKTRQLQQARNSAMKLMQGGNIQGGIAQLMGVGDTEGAKTLVGYYKSMHPTMTPYETFEAGRDLKKDEEQAAKDQMAAIPNDQKLYWINNPASAPAWFKQAIGMGGDAGTPQPATAPQPATGVQPTSTVQPPTPGQTYDQWKYQQRHPTPPRADSEKQMGMIDQQLDAVTSGADDLINDPHLPQAVGGWSNAIPEIAKSAVGVLTANPNMIMKDYPPGYGNIAPESMVAGTPIAGTKARLETLKTQIALAATSTMRAMSKTGASAFSRITQYEFQALQNSMAALNAAQGPEDIKKALQQVKEHTQKLKDSYHKDFNATYGDAQETPAPQQPQQATQPSNATGATQPVKSQPPEQMFSFLDNAPIGQTGTLKFSDGTTVKAVKRQDGHWYSLADGKKVR